MANKINLDTSQRLDITCRKGDTFSIQVTIKGDSDTNENLTSDQFSMQVRSRASADGPSGLIMTTNPSQRSLDSGTDSPALPLLDTSINDALGLFELNRGSGISTESTYGVLTISASAFEMTKIPSGRYVYDLQRYSSNSDDQKTLIHGSFIVNEDISEAGARLIR